MCTPACVCASHLPVVGFDRWGGGDRLSKVGRFVGLVVAFVSGAGLVLVCGGRTSDPSWWCAGAWGLPWPGHRPAVSRSWCPEPCAGACLRGSLAIVGAVACRGACRGFHLEFRRPSPVCSCAIASVLSGRRSGVGVQLLAPSSPGSREPVPRSLPQRTARGLLCRGCMWLRVSLECFRGVYGVEVERQQWGSAP